MRAPIACCVVFCLLYAPAASAQSMLEYGALLTATGAAGAAAAGEGEEKEDGEAKGSSRAGGIIGSTASRVYEQGMQTAAERSGALLGQVGRGVSTPPPAEEEEAAPVRVRVTREEPPPDAAEPAAGPGDAGLGEVEVVLNDGTVVRGVLLEQTAEYVRVESAGVTVTFFGDEVANVRAPEETP